MSAPVAAVLARTTGATPCSRCLAGVAVHAGTWHAADHDATHRAVCDTCAARDDPAGYAARTSWRRASSRPATGRKGRS